LSHVSFDLSDYQSRYVPTTELPVDGPDSYDVEKKRRALFQPKVDWTRMSTVENPSSKRTSIRYTDTLS
jgi:hypothetical protein